MICVLEHRHRKVTKSTIITLNVYVYVGAAWLDVWFYESLVSHLCLHHHAFSMYCIAWLLMRMVNLSVGYLQALARENVMRALARENVMRALAREVVCKH